MNGPVPSNRRSPIRIILLLTVILGLFLSVVPAADPLPVPKLQQRVTDLAGILTAKEISRMDQDLAAFEARTSNQIAVLIIPSLEGRVLEDYSIKVARQWGLGTKENDNGVLLLVVVRDRKIRIEVGLGLQGALTDALSSRIIRNEMAPLLARGHEQWYAAISAGVHSIEQATQGEYKGTGKASTGHQRRGLPTGGALVGGFFVLGIIGRLFRFWVSLIVGALAGLFFMGLLGLGIGAIAGLLAPFVLSGRGGYIGGGGFSGGGGGFSGGGFSGGGGFFDGGGASGDF